MNHETIVVDNNSTDNSCQCAREMNNVRLITCEDNGGYARGVNTGIKNSKGELILVANPDIVFGDNAIQYMISSAEARTETGIVGPKIKNFDGTLQYECKRNQPTLLNSLLYFLNLQNKWADQYVRKDEKYYEKSEYVNAVSGSCMLLKRKALEECGLFDEDYFMYGEDLDICYRMTKAGYKIYYNSEAVVYHYKGGCTKNNKLAYKYKTESLIKLINKRNNYNFMQRFMVVLLIKIGYKAKMIKESI
jgi:GT2 family glycosyltransferase